MSKIVTIKSEAELLKAFSGGVMYGYTPAEKVDTTTFVYPIKFELDDSTKTFKIYIEPAKEEKKEEVKETATTEESSKKKLSKGAIAGIVIGVVAAVAIIVGVTCALVL